MTKYFEPNAHGLKGSDIDTSKTLVVVWGNSVVFGIGDGWVEGLSDYFPGYQFLNGGLEGDPLQNICERIAEINAHIKINYNIIFPG